MTFGEKQLTRWMELVRTTDDGIEAFWPSQIKSKTWICNELEFKEHFRTCVIFGSWYGVLADMLNFPEIVCVDKPLSTEKTSTSDNDVPPFTAA